MQGFDRIALTTTLARRRGRTGRRLSSDAQIEQLMRLAGAADANGMRVYNLTAVRDPAQMVSPASAGFAGGRAGACDGAGQRVLRCRRRRRPARHGAGDCAMPGHARHDDRYGAQEDRLPDAGQGWNSVWRNVTVHTGAGRAIAGARSRSMSSLRARIRRTGRIRQLVRPRCWQPAAQFIAMKGALPAAKNWHALPAATGRCAKCVR